jgi:hypothetical protein
MKNHKPYWQQPNWYCLSPRRKYPWKLSDRSDWQDILSTYECLLPDPEGENQPEPDAEKQD